MLELTTIEFSEACNFVRLHHRHHKPPVGHRYSIAIVNTEILIEGNPKIVGVVIVGRPVARGINYRTTVEVLRLATDGTKNACSMLYAAAWRAAKELRYKKLITYILDTEPGTSLRAAGWRCIGQAGGGSWNRSNRLREDKHPLQGKIKYEAP